MYSYGPLHMAEQKQGDQFEPTYSSTVRIRGVTLRTCRKRWTMGRGGEKGPGISVLMARHDDDDGVVFWLVNACSSNKKTNHDMWGNRVIFTGKCIYQREKLLLTRTWDWWIENKDMVQQYNWLRYKERLFTFWSQTVGISSYCHIWQMDQFIVWKR